MSVWIWVSQTHFLLCLSAHLWVTQHTRTHARFIRYSCNAIILDLNISVPMAIHALCNSSNSPCQAPTIVRPLAPYTWICGPACQTVRRNRKCWLTVFRQQLGCRIDSYSLEEMNHCMHSTARSPDSSSKAHRMTSLQEDDDGILLRAVRPATLRPYMADT